MATPSQNPNIVNVTVIRGNTAYIVSSGTTVTTNWTADGASGGATALTGLTPPTATVNKIGNIVVSNTSSSAVNCTIAISNNATFASGTAYPIASAVSVPPNASLIVVDKTTSFYVTENQSVGLTSGTTGGVLTAVASFEAIT
jgi:hypothetical protein